MKRALTFALAASAATFASMASATPVDLTSWTHNGSGNWTVAGDNNSVTQSLNANPGVFFGPGNSQGNQLSGTIRVNTYGDDDFIGFVLGYNSGDLSNASADYLLIDWKQGTQIDSGCVGPAGLALSRVTGAMNTADAWCHSNNVTELARGANLGSTGWSDLTQYTFDLVFNPTNVQVWVGGVQEINLNGSFADGSFGFYNYSQSNVTYGAIQQTVAPPPTDVPEPASILLFGMGLMGVGAIRRRRARA